VGSQNPGGGNQCAERHHDGRHEVQPRPDPLQTEQHDTQEPGLQKECREHLVSEQRAGDAARKIGKAAPVRAELVGHDEARYYAHAEIHGKDLEPVLVQRPVDRVARLEPEAFQHRQIACEPDGDGGKDDMERYGERELQPGQHQCVEFHTFSSRSSCPLARTHHKSMRSILEPSTETPAIRPAFVSANATTGSLMVDVSTRPFAPTVATATVASTPAVQPELLRKSLSASWVMNRITIARDWAPACKPKDPADVL